MALDDRPAAADPLHLINELRRERDEALAREAAIAEVLQVINASPGDLAPVFDAMVEKATRLCGAPIGHLLRYENGVFYRTASIGVPREFDQLLPLGQPLTEVLSTASYPMRVLASRAVLNVPDTRQDEAYLSGAPAEVAAVEAGIRSALFVPLLKEGEVVGVFIVMHREVRPCTDKQIALLQNFAGRRSSRSKMRA